MSVLHSRFEVPPPPLPNRGGSPNAGWKTDGAPASLAAPHARAAENVAQTQKSRNTYQWSGPNGPLSATGASVSGLASGWYSVTVTCPLTGQSTTGWYWVPRRRRGRTKAETNVELTATPNPFDVTTNIEFSIPESEYANVSVYSLDGKQVAVVFDGEAQADEVYTVPFNAGNLSTGVYVVKIQTASGEMQTSKVILNK